MSLRRNGVKNLSPQALGLSGSQNELIELALSFGFVDSSSISLILRRK